MVRLKTLANAADAPEKFLAKLLQNLTRAELVVSRRGPNGGFELTPGAQNATMMQVIEAIEGPLALNLCLGEKGCERQEWCPAHSVWAQAQDAMLTVLQRHTIRDLAVLGEKQKADHHASVPGSADVVAIQSS